MTPAAAKAAGGRETPPPSVILHYLIPEQNLHNKKLHYYYLYPAQSEGSVARAGLPTQARRSPSPPQVVMGKYRRGWKYFQPRACARDKKGLYPEGVKVILLHVNLL
jgi:hypothetical protein